MRTLRTVVALILREIGSSHGRSALGYLWSVIEPVLTILVLTVMFSILSRTPPLGQSFPLFYASGLLPFMLFNEVAGKVASAVNFSKPLLAFPGVTYLDALLARFLLAVLTKVVIYAIVLIGVIFIYDVDPFFQYEYIVLGLVLAMLLAFSLGVINCLLFRFFPIWHTLWGMINRPLMFVSGIILLVEHIPHPYQEWLTWNPLVHVVAITRMGLYPTYAPGYVSFTYIIAIIAFSIPIGLFMMRRYWRDLIDPTW